MNSNWNHAITLISYDEKYDDEGFKIVLEKKVEHIPANFKSVTRAEEEHSKILGYSADLIIEVLSSNFNNQETIVDEDTKKKYAIKRIFFKTSEIIELIVSDITKRQENGKI